MRQRIRSAHTAFSVRFPPAESRERYIHTVGVLGLLSSYSYYFLLIGWFLVLGKEYTIVHFSLCEVFGGGVGNESPHACKPRCRQIGPNLITLAKTYDHRRFGRGRPSSSRQKRGILPRVEPNNGTASSTRPRTRMSVFRPELRSLPNFSIAYCMGTGVALATEAGRTTLSC